MRIEHISIDEVTPGRSRVAASPGDDELWFDVPVSRNALPTTIADSFLIMALAGSMLRNEDIVVADEYPVSRHLVDNLHTIQKVFHHWNRQFKPVEIHASLTDPDPGTAGCISCFSGGIDSIHCLLTNQSRVDSTLFIGGYDFSFSGPELAVAESRNQAILQVLGLPGVSVYTNQMEWGQRTGVARDFWNSGYLAAAASLLGVHSVLIPSSRSFDDLQPNGSHLILDHLWTNGATQFEHVGAQFKRSEKIAQVCAYPQLLDLLHVCWRSSTENCGRCGKCLRTMIALECIGKTGPFPRRITEKDIRKLVITSSQDQAYFIDNILFAHSLGRRDLVRALKAPIRRFDRANAFVYADRGFLFGKLSHLKKRFRPYTTRVGRTNGRPDLDL
ncbi:hypothetical protein [Parahaliea aestuarii]|uniref:7-cyano-7-deazaguanine synthase n=1 Tax=Parahaliea aestuarii TaxID=1852021 RepID=A0A5C8ZVA0_9GAMM|nr:hypothetical protein [Parahaliea aestuarii]TXS92465.1 hypothetical protein FVW59_08580 [Parahaliea aestuarii]